MLSLTLKEIKEAVNGKIVQGNPSKSFNNITIDSRRVKPGDIFVAIIGENNDGHEFIPQAVEKGAELIITSRSLEPYSNLAILQVKDTTRALQNLSSYNLAQIEDINVIGVTGSAGKTTTKDMVFSVISTKNRALKSPENYNNEYGLPLSLLELEGDEDVAVLEMATRNKGDIKLLTEIAPPQIGILTNIGAAHLENFQSVENVAEAKKELLEGLTGPKVAIINNDDKQVKKVSEEVEGLNLIAVSLEDDKADYYAFQIKVSPNGKESRFKVKEKKSKEIKNVKLNRSGEHNIYNALFAIAGARYLNMDWENIKEGLSEVDVTELRQEIRKYRGTKIINDTYNANPLSMRAAIDFLTDIKGERKITVLGPMLELGGFERVAHLELGKYIYENNIDVLVTVGETAKTIAEGAINEGMPRQKVYVFSDRDEAAVLLRKIQKEDDVILVKGSRSMKMEEIVELLLEQRD